MSPGSKVLGSSDHSTATVGLKKEVTALRKQPETPKGLIISPFQITDEREYFYNDCMDQREVICTTSLKGGVEVLSTME